MKSKIMITNFVLGVVFIVACVDAFGCIIRGDDQGTAIFLIFAWCIMQEIGR